MTLQEAIEILKRNKPTSDPRICGKELCIACNVAIEVLEKTMWIPVSERLPENEQNVEITYTSKHWKTGELLYFTCRAFYTDGTMSTEDSSYAWNEIDNWEYNEDLDAYIIPEGWWEVVGFAEAFGCVDQPVIAWRPLPEPYKAGEQE